MCGRWGTASDIATDAMMRSIDAKTLIKSHSLVWILLLYRDHSIGIVKIHNWELTKEGRAMASKRRVVITGLGAIAPNGVGKDRFWEGLIQGRSGIRRITRFDASNFPCQIAGEVADF